MEDEELLVDGFKKKVFLISFSFGIAFVFFFPPLSLLAFLLLCLSRLILYRMLS